MTEKPRKLSLGYVGKLLITLGIFAVLLYVIGPDLKQLPEAMSGISWPLLLAAFAINTLGGVVLPAVTSLYAVDSDKLKLNLYDLVRINFVIRFYSLFLPRGGAVAMRWHRYKKSGSGGDALALVVFEKLVLVLSYAGAAVVCLALDFDRLQAGGWQMAVGLAGLTLAITAAMFPFFSRACSNWMQRLFGKERKYVPKSLSSGVTKLLAAVAAYQDLSRQAVLRIIGMSMLSYALFVAGAYVVALGMDVPIDLLSLAWMRSAVFLLTLIPVTVGGLGVRELSFVGFMALYGVPKSQALGFSLVLFAIQTGIGLLGALYEIQEHFAKPKAKLTPTELNPAELTSDDSSPAKTNPSDVL